MCLVFYFSVSCSCKWLTAHIDSSRVAKALRIWFCKEVNWKKKPLLELKIVRRSYDVSARSYKQCSESFFLPISLLFLCIFALSQQFLLILSVQNWLFVDFGGKNMQKCHGASKICKYASVKMCKYYGLLSKSAKRNLQKIKYAKTKVTTVKMCKK